MGKDAMRKHWSRPQVQEQEVGLEVTDLLRTAIGSLTLDDLPEGRWRLVSSDELRELTSSAA